MKYLPDEVRKLKSYGKIPENIKGNEDHIDTHQDVNVAFEDNAGDESDSSESDKESEKDGFSVESSSEEEKDGISEEDSEEEKSFDSLDSI